MKLFLNNASLGFDDMDSAKPAQVIKLSPNDLVSSKVIALKPTNFPTASVLTVFISSNQTGASSTLVSRIRCFGVGQDTADVSKIKDKPEGH